MDAEVKISAGQNESLFPADAIIKVENLHTYFYTDLGISRALNGVSFTVPTGKVLGVVGESGCGKSVTALSIMQLVPHPGRTIRGKILLRTDEAGHEIVDITALKRNSPAMRHLRGGKVGMIFQEPMTSLNPAYTIGNQIVEAILLHQAVHKKEAETRAVSMLEKVGLPNPGDVIRRFPHELSGGMRQRVMIGIALSCNPAVLIADEPTTALDVTTEAQILDLMRELQADLGMTTMLITHNLGVVAQMCDNAVVMYLGRIVEQSPVDDLFYDPKHPYTKALLHSIPHVGSRTKSRLEPIQGMVPDPYASIPGCPFHPRCNYFKPGICDVSVPALTHLSETHAVRCFLFSDQGEKESES
jgi:peptide/nickel transport system ATP-binding protein